MVSVELKAHIIANIIIKKKKDIEQVSIPEDCKLQVYSNVGYAKVMQGEIYEGINILRKAKDMGGKDFIAPVAKIAFKKIRERRIAEGSKIIRILEALGYRTDYEQFISIDDIIDIARMVLKDNRLEEGFSLLNLLMRMNTRSFVPIITEIGYEKIVAGETETGIKILEKVKELVGDEAIQFLGDYIFNRLKSGDVEMGLQLLGRIASIVGDKYLAHAAEIGYQKIAKGDVELGIRIIDGVKKLGGQVDESILQVVNEA